MLRPMTTDHPQGGPPAHHPATFLIVDDSDAIRTVLARMVEGLGHQVETASDGLEALGKLALGVDLVLVDANMPGMDGFEVTRLIRSDPVHFDLPVVMVTGAAGPQERLLAAEAGVSDFLSKPVDRGELATRTRTLLLLKQAHDALKRQRAELESIVQSRTESLRKALDESARARRELARALGEVQEANRKLRGGYEEIVLRLALAAELRSGDAFAHLQRVSRYSEVLARGLGMPVEFVEDLRLASMLHDIGKLAAPESDGAPSHAVMGSEILEGSASRLLQMGEMIARWHHERWDGEGYPDGLAGVQIPLPARIVAVADALDHALTETLHLPEALQRLAAERGKTLDPGLVELLHELRQEVEPIRSSFD